MLSVENSCNQHQNAKENALDVVINSVDNTGHSLL